MVSAAIGAKLMQETAGSGCENTEQGPQARAKPVSLWRQTALLVRALSPLYSPEEDVAQLTEMLNSRPQP